MRHETEALLEHVLTAVMQQDTDALTLAITLRNTVPQIRVTELIRTLLAAEALIHETFGPGNADAALARAIALGLTEVADDHEAALPPEAATRLLDIAS